MNRSVLCHHSWRLVGGLVGGLSLILISAAASSPSGSDAAVASIPGSLSGVSAASPSSVWAVGSYCAPACGNSGVDRALILRWNGARWTRTSPGPGRSSSLSAVSAVSAADAWAVGGYCAAGCTGTAPDNRTLIVHWNGVSWAQVASPSPSQPALNGVSADSRRDAWAVGTYGSGRTARTLVLHWNGTAWARVSSPSPGGSAGSVLTAVSALDPTDAWAVGYYGTSSGARKTLVLRWDGTSWAQVASPSRGTPTFSALNGVSASSASRAWAVGWNYFAVPDEQKTAVLRWKGTAWRQSASPSPGSGDNIFALLNAVSARPGSVWAVGTYLASNTTISKNKTLILRRSGAGWTVVASPNPSPSPGGSFLQGVSALSPSSAWAVGYYGSSASGTQPRTLILHWNGTAWKRS